MLYAIAFLFLFTMGGLNILVVLLLNVVLNTLKFKLNLIQIDKLYYQSAICWEVLIIKLQIYFNKYVRMFNFEQSAGNRKGTSETTRWNCKFTVKYSPFNNYLFSKYKNNYLIYNSYRHYSTIDNFNNNYNNNNNNNNNNIKELSSPARYARGRR